MTILQRLSLPAVLFAALLSACNLRLSDQQTVDNTLPLTVTPAALVGDWQLQKPGSPAVYKGDPQRSTVCMRLTPDGCGAVMMETVPDGRTVKLSGTLRFETGAYNEEGEFWLLVLETEVLSDGDGKAASTGFNEVREKRYRYQQRHGRLCLQSTGQPAEILWFKRYGATD